MPWAQTLKERRFRCVGAPDGEFAIARNVYLYPDDNRPCKHIERLTLTDNGATEKVWKWPLALRLGDEFVCLECVLRAAGKKTKRKSK